MARVLSFPARDDVTQYDIPAWITFWSANYSTWASKRIPNQVRAYPNNIIALPYPTTFNTLNTIPYRNSPSVQMRGIEALLKGKPTTGPDRTAADEAVRSNQAAEIGLDKDAAVSRTELKESFYTGGNVWRFDQMETVLQPGCRRVHSFEFNLVAKTIESAKQAARIAAAFQANAHPGNFTQSIYTMNHPDIWVFGIGNVIGSSNIAMDGQGLTSVLARVDINRSPIQNYPYTVTESGVLPGSQGYGKQYPLATNIKLSFIELEPALNWGVYDGFDYLAIRSQKDIL